MFCKMQCYKSYWLPLSTRSLTTSPVFHLKHYEVLGLTPKATQRDIKTAYYKLSMQHHPDKSKSASSADFRAITEAYEVLGNVKLKKMYDKGLLSSRRSKSVVYEAEPEETEPDDPSTNIYKTHSKRASAPTMDGRTPIYNFDAWTKEHYGELLKRSIHDRGMRDVIRKKRRYHNEAAVQEAYMVFFVTAIVVIIILILQPSNFYDVDKTKHARKESKSEK